MLADHIYVLIVNSVNAIKSIRRQKAYMQIYAMYDTERGNTALCRRALLTGRTYYISHAHCPMLNVGNVQLVHCAILKVSMQ